MKYALTTFFCIFLLNVNFAQSEMSTTRSERNQIGQIEQAKKSATKTFLVSLDRYSHAVEILDLESQAEIKKDMMMRMTKLIATNKEILKVAPRSEANKTQVAEIKTMLTQQNALLKEVEKTADAQETEKLVLKFLETL